MSDALSLSVLTASALTQGFGFLYGRLNGALDRRSHQSSDDLEDQSGTEVLAEVPVSLHIQPPALTSGRTHRLELARRAMEPYARDPALIDPADPALLQIMAQLRNDLEAVYGQRFTFRGENRPRPGVRVVHQVDHVEGTARAVKAKGISSSATVDIDYRVGKVWAGGESTALEIDGTIG
ncbi:hypothetical protein GCM10010195_19210 [Kitasatospora griseola]|nr:hypothetical protein GCM10010195_19210 [Kitasatospora griseola]